METYKTEWTSTRTSEKNIMAKRLITICTTAILVIGIYGCAQTVEDVPAAEPENPPENITLDADIIQHDSADMVYDNTLFTEENSYIRNSRQISFMSPGLRLIRKRMSM